MFEILSPSLERLGTLEYPVSDNHSIHWQESGTMVLIALATEHNLELTQNDRYILVRDDLRQGGRADGLYLICNVVHDEDKRELTINGKSALFLLHQRVSGDSVLTDTTAGAALAALIGDNARGLPVEATAESAGDPAVVRYPLSGGALDSQIAGLMAYCGIGVEATLGGSVIRLAFSAGRDLSEAASVAVLGSQSGRAKNASLAIDISDYCNVAVGHLAWQSGKTEAFEWGATGAHGAGRRELYIGPISQNRGESEDAFRGRAEQDAQEKLVAHLLRTTISADISPADYGRPYLVGDIVRVQIGTMVIRKRIIAATWLHDQSSDKVTLTLGDQLNTVVAEIKEQTKAASAKAGSAAKRTEEQEKRINGIETDYKALFAQVTDLVAGMDAYVLNKTFEDYKYAVARLFAAMQEKDEQLSAEVAVKVSTDDLKETLANYALAASLSDYLTIKSAAEMYTTSDDVTAAIGAYLVETVDGHKYSLVDIASQVGQVAAGLQTKADQSTVEAQGDDIAKLQTAQADLTSRVDGAESSLETKADRQDVEALDGSVSALATAQAALASRVGDAETALTQKVSVREFNDAIDSQDEAIAEVQEAQASLTTRVGNVETGLSQKVSTDDLTDTLKNYALASALKDYLTVKAAQELYVTDSKVTAAIGAYIVSDSGGNKATLAAMLADIIKLQGDTEIVGNLTISDGRLSISKGVVANGTSQIWGDLGVSGKLFVNKSGLYISGEPYTPVAITSTAGTEYTVLGQ